ncbi:MAG TPA: TonB-dependent receptor [Sphingomonas sp.]|nr:TonB-dependent receptor [Sphingomonas sp.]
MPFALEAIRHNTLRYAVSAAALTAASLVLAATAQAQDAPARTNPGTSTTAEPQQTPALPAAAANTEAQGLQDIVVTAERQTSNVQRVPAAVTVQSGGDLLTRGKFTLTNILEVVPGVSGGESEGLNGINTGSDNAAAGITIRGISSNGGLSGQTLSGVSAVALYVDDVSSGLGGNYDIDRVEVLRGPQGTLYGRSATAGVVAIHTRNPDLDTSTMEASLEGGSYDLLHATVAANVPIISDKVGLRVAVNHYQRDGIDADTGNGRSNVTEGRAKLLIQPSDNFSLLIGGAFQDRTLYNGGFKGNFLTPNSYEVEPYKAGTGILQSRQIWAEANLDIGGVRVTYLPAYRTFKQDATVYLVGPGGNTIKQIVNTPHDPFVTQELRLQSQPGANIQWQTGLFYYYNDVRSTNLNVWDSSNAALFNADIQRKTKDIGAFAETTVPITSSFRITGGLRYDKTTVDTSELYTSNLNFACNTPIGAFACPIGPLGAPTDSPLAGLPENNVSTSLSGQAGHREFKNLTYKARAEYDLSPSNLVYASVSTGFSPGDVQVGTGAGGLPAAFAYGSENLTSYEIGTKNRFFDRRLQVNASAFHYDYGGYQAAIQLDLSNPTSAVVFNVPLRMTGVELEGLLQVTPADRLGVNFAHIDSKFHDLPAGFATAVAQHKLWGYAPNTATVFYDRQFELAGGSAISFHGEGIWRSGYDILYTSPGLAAQGGLAFQHQNAFFQGNLNLTFTTADKKYSLTGYVRNVTDKRYKTYVNLQSITPLQVTGLLSDPRTFGVVLTAKF